MSYFITDALAEGAAPAGPPDLIGGLLPFLILGVFFFLFVLPQWKRGREQKKMIESLTKGLEVVTSGGILGKIADVDDNFVLLEVSEDMYLYVQKHSITSMMPKGTYKARKK
ncbi:MAG: preprotein translocase subunit YajC [Methylococcaceae bacterium]|nr:preprotein translocase subunit YajC [Methylococcaceae bacterium]